MKCYFCNKEVQMEPDNSPGTFHTRMSKSCDYCTKTHGIHHVSCVYEKDDVTYKYVHIYTDEQKYIRIGATSFFDRGIVVETNTTYHVRLNFEDKTTSFLVYGTTKELLRLPTFNITPANVREKLKLYLLFS
jgi:hypothetical protein